MCVYVYVCMCVYTHLVALEHLSLISSFSRIQLFKCTSGWAIHNWTLVCILSIDGSGSAKSKHQLQTIPERHTAPKCNRHTPHKPPTRRGVAALTPSDVRSLSASSSHRAPSTHSHYKRLSWIGDCVIYIITSSSGSVYIYIYIYKLRMTTFRYFVELNSWHKYI